MTTSCPFPSPPQSAAAYGLWKGEEPPLATVASHRHMDGGGGGGQRVRQVRRRGKCEGSREVRLWLAELQELRCGRMW